MIAFKWSESAPCRSGACGHMAGGYICEAAGLHAALAGCAPNGIGPYSSFRCCHGYGNMESHAPRAAFTEFPPTCVCRSFIIKQCPRNTDMVVALLRQYWAATALLRYCAMCHPRVHMATQHGGQLHKLRSRAFRPDRKDVRRHVRPRLCVCAASANLLQQNHVLVW